MLVYNTLQHLLGSISTYRIFGFIPLGMILHISISAAITIILLKRGVKFKNVFIIVFCVGLTKEILDCFVLNNTLKKHFLDMAYDMSYPTLLYFIRRQKTRVLLKKTPTKKT